MEAVRLVTLTYSAEINFVISFTALRFSVDSFSDGIKKAEYTGAEKRVGKILLNDCMLLHSQKYQLIWFVKTIPEISYLDNMKCSTVLNTSPVLETLFVCLFCLFVC